jgi:hypothetical protein
MKFFFFFFFWKKIIIKNGVDDFGQTPLPLKVHLWPCMDQEIKYHKPSTKTCNYKTFFSTKNDPSPARPADVIE